MQKRLSTMILCITAAVAIFALVAAPALAHHKEGHEQGGGNNEATDENFQQADQESSSADASSEDGTTKESASKNESVESEASEETSAASSSEEGGSPNSQREPDPDPTPSQAPPSNKGPSECGDYSGQEGGPYDHDNCDGSQGMNGTDGNGKCASCTGKADDKSPGGQHPGDHNNGYECDHNGGVGKGNPAHSRCPQPQPTTTSLCPPGTDLAGLPPGPTGCDIPPNEFCPPGTDLAGLPPGPTGCDIPPNELCPPGTDMAGLPPGPDGCDDDVEGRTDEVCPEGTELAGEDMTDLEDCVLGKILHNGSPKPPLGAVLPFTGAGDIYSAIAIGLLLIAMGMVSLKLRKKT